MSIKIKKSHRGLLHKNLGVPAGKPIPAAKLKVKSTDSAAVKKRKVFAQNAKHWKKGQDGLQLDPNQQSQYNWYQSQGDNTQWLQQPQQSPIDLRTLQGNVNLSTLPGSTVPNLNLPKFNHATPKPPTKRTNSLAKGTIGEGLLAGLLAADALIPPDKIKLPVQRPQNTFNPYPYGTGSQAIAKDGITLSKTGYKANSKDKNKPKLRIPSNRITMKNVPHPVLGTDDMGNSQLMMPNEEYQFPGNYVDETPMYQAGSKPIYTSNPNDPRLQAYNDSLNLYNDHPIPTGARNIRGYKPIQALTPVGNINNVNQYITGVAEDPFANDKIKPYKEYDFTHPQEGAYLNGQLTHDVGVSTGYSYKKPVQPVIYSTEPQRTGHTENLPIANIPNIPNGPTIGLSPRNVDIPRAEYDFTKKTKYAFAYPDENGQQKNMYFPTKSMLQNFIKSTKGTSSQEGDDYMTAAGYLEDGGIIAKDGHWLQGAVNPAHKGYCTPMTKSTCTPRRKAFAMTMKKHHGFHEDGGSMNASPIDLSTPLVYGGTEAKPVRSPMYDFGGEISLPEFLEEHPGNAKNPHVKQLFGYHLEDGGQIAYWPFYKAQAGATFQSQQEIDEANAYAKSLSTRKGLVPGQNAYVARNIGDPKPVMMVPQGMQPNSQLKQKAFSVPSYVQRSDFQTSEGNAWYTDPQTGNVVDVDMSVLNQARFKKSPEQQQADLLARSITKLDSGGSLSSDKAKEMLRDGTAHGKKLTAKQKRYFGYIAGGGTPKAENGMTILDQNTVQFNGPSHDNGGIDIAYGGKKAEVEGDETGYISPVDNSLSIMGNMKNPLTNRKFKQDSKILSEKEAKMDSLLNDGYEMIDKNSPHDPWERLKFNGGRVMMTGAQQKKQELLQSKEHLKALQQAMLEHAHENNLDPQEFSEGKAKYGKTMKANYKDGGIMQAGGTWDYRGTNTKGLDDKISGFVKLLMDKGLTGYSGQESGVSQRNTKSGRLSRHAKGEALDAFISQPDAYNKVLGDKDLSKYLIDNGLTAINEYDPNVAKQTGATAGHLHIGYDRGTPISDKFRQDAAAKYKTDNTDWNWGYTRAPKGKAISTNPAGDQQFFPYDSDKVKFNDKLPQNVQQPPQNIPISGGYKFVNPSSRPIPSDAQPLEWDQLLPEAYAAATSQPASVFMQQYNPQLYQPYNVSFQDQRNENEATFAPIAKTLGRNPSAISTLASQKYSADSSSLANEFRANQQIYSDVVNKNVSLLNDAQLKNLGLADTQYVRQETAKSNSKAIKHNVLNSISSKLLENEANNRMLGVYENLYDYRFTPQDGNMNAEYMGAPGQEYIDWTGGGMGEATSNQFQSLKQNYDKSGRLTSTNVMTPSASKQELDQLQLQNKQMQRFPGVFRSNYKMNLNNLLSMFPNQ